MPDLKASCAAKQLLHDVVSDAHKGLSMAIEDCPTCRWSTGDLGKVRPSWPTCGFSNRACSSAAAAPS